MRFCVIGLNTSFIGNISIRMLFTSCLDDILLNLFVLGGTPLRYWLHNESSELC